MDGVWLHSEPPSAEESGSWLEASVNPERQVDYWVTLSARDIGTADILMKADRPLEALFFAHMGLEKALKARIVRATGEPPPHLHNLSRLAEASGPGIPEDVLDFLAEMNRFQVHGRYPLSLDYRPSKEEVARCWPRAREVRECLIRTS
ncbi:MAG: HEPN domain-containing protein [Deltaproteobacteria bacterium]|nr:HEPN domain-containing protein [Deltaproteobacteria bacterium]